MQDDDRCVQELFEVQADATPDCVALIADSPVTFRTLHERSNQLAYLLREQGVGPEVLIGLFFDRSADLIIGLLAILKAGGAFVPLEPDLPRSRLLHMIGDTNLKFVISNPSLESELPTGTHCVLFLDDEQTQLNARPTANLECVTKPDNAAYVLYTSGSAGEPKGVIGTHRSITTRLNTRSLQLAGDEEVFCLSSSIRFGFAIARLFLSLLSGFPLLLLKDTEVKDVHVFVDRLERARVTNIGVVPDLLDQILDIHSISWRLRALRTVTVGGAPLPFNLVQKFKKTLPQAKLVNQYGGTEAGTICAGEVKLDTSKDHFITVGHPLPNTRVYILNNNMDQVAVGVSGEIYVGGRHIALGYLNQAGLTAERFVPDPFEGTGARMYRTGDAGSYLPNGEIELLGRIDRQFKVRGYRVDPAEIEGLLQNHPSIRAAAVTLHERLGGTPQLIAFVVCESGGRPPTSVLRSYVSEQLPSYMVPARFYFLNDLPRTPNGKVNLSALTVSENHRPMREVPYVEPGSSVEATIAEIWGRFLGIEQVGVNDEFLELGGDSIIAVSVALEIENHFGLPVSPREVLECSTVAQFCARMLEADQLAGE